MRQLLKVEEGHMGKINRPGIGAWLRGEGGPLEVCSLLGIVRHHWLGTVSPPTGTTVRTRLCTALG